MIAFRSLSNGASFAIAALVLTACGSGSPAPNTSLQPSTDPTLTAIISAFSEGCIKNAPGFEESAVSAGFQSAPSTGLPVLLSAEQDNSCRVFVRGYGVTRPAPSSGDLVALASELQARVGGSVSQASGSRVRVRGGSGNYNVSGYVSGDGSLTFNVYR